MTGKHTPGPWEVEECYDGGYEITSPGSTLEKTRLIGVIRPACNIKNDAPLIEAAPVLLEAAKKAKLAIQDKLQRVNYKNEVILFEVFKCLEKAIFIAEGGEK